MKSETGVKDFSRTPPPASLVPLPFQGRLYYKLANAVKIKLTTCTGKHLNANITDTGKGNNRRWQAPGGQRGQRANSAGRFRHGSTRSCISRRNPSTSFAGPPPLSGEAYAQVCGAMWASLSTHSKRFFRKIQCCKNKKIPLHSQRDFCISDLFSKTSE